MTNSARINSRMIFQALHFFGVLDEATAASVTDGEISRLITSESSHGGQLNEAVFKSHGSGFLQSTDGQSTIPIVFGVIAYGLMERQIGRGKLLSFLSSLAKENITLSLFAEHGVFAGKKLNELLSGKS